MKTTVELNDALMVRAKTLASQRQQTFKSILEMALRQFLDDNSEPQGAFTLRKHSFGGQGIKPPLREGHWTEIREHIYEGRGG
ncbi:DUF2191 domain-containing protein [Lyngbya confervoides]|uniref:DUF2191 domain-containing protein n=1 Tax=Lyngbya confervoides BDU141951 TaxID=1574623 RepID=A0ABD4T1N9_9CYAN|nr:DUF2191 domain-containing protein [Lyngbya confervoides]MCM1982403.1 hypothetical protein [Lyngbya confervoides BDU141951]